MNLTKIGDYEITREIGRGGMATVYLAFDPGFEREVAIKVLPPEFLRDPILQERFKKEALTIGKLEISGIVPVHEYGVQGGQPYLVMRYMRGGSLRERIEGGPLSIQEASRIFDGITPALDYVHRRGVIHRDLKPDNILFDEQGNPYLVDFGIAKLSETSQTLTGNAIVGTPAYMSPEQARGDKDLDGRSDIYALGAILFEMLTGQLPYSATTPMGQAIKHITDPVPNILEKRSDLPPEVQAIIALAMAKRRESRFATASELAAALASVARGEPLPRLVTKKTMQLSSSEMEVPLKPPAKTPKPQPPPRLPVQERKPEPQPVSPLPIKARRAERAQPLISAEEISQPKAQPSPRPRFYVLLSIGLLLSLGAGAIYLFSSRTSNKGLPASPAPTNTALVMTETNPVSLLSTEATATQTPLPEPTLKPTEVPETSPVPTNTAIPTVLPTVPVIGGADQIAFLNAQDIWVANLDGTGLLQLTSDGEEKTNLQWILAGKAIKYLAGNCVYSVELDTGKKDFLACFQPPNVLNSYEISKDGKNVAISLNKELFVVPNDPVLLREAKKKSDLADMAECRFLAPYTHNGATIAVKYARWSNDGTRLAIVRLAPVNGQQADLVQILDISRCFENLDRLDEFPGVRFRMEGYTSTPLLQNVAWDGDLIFAMNSFIRNDGFGDLWLYNTELHTGYEIAPIDGVCCYRDPQFSPDGRYLTFAFQDIREGSKGSIQLYVIRIESEWTGLSFSSPMQIPLREDFFSDREAKPQPVLLPANQ